MRRFWPTSPSSLLAAALLAAGPLCAQSITVHQCQGPSGTLILSDRPCPPGQTELRRHRLANDYPEAEVPALPAAPPPAGDAEPAPAGPDPPLHCGRFDIHATVIVQGTVMQHQRKPPVRCAEVEFSVTGASSRINDQGLAQRLYRALGVRYQDGRSGPRDLDTSGLPPHRRAQFCDIHSDADRLQARDRHAALCCFGAYPYEIETVGCR